MAEYIEVMKQANRICKTYREGKCLKECPLHKGSIGCGGFIMSNPQEAEEIIINWGKNHPIKTNADKFKEVFGFKPNGCPSTKAQCIGSICVNCDKYDFWSQEYKEPKEV